MSPRKRISEGDPVAPVSEVKSEGLHERDVYIAAALSSAHKAWLQDAEGRFLLSAADIADRAVRIADAVMERKERAS